MPQQTGNRVFEFFPLEDRILLSGDGVDAEALSADPDSAVLDALIEQLQTPEQAAGEASPGGELAQLDRIEDAIADSVDEGQPESRRTEIVFVDGRLPDSEGLLADLRSENDRPVEFIVRYLDEERDGIEQMTQAIQAFDGLAAVHVIGHGDHQGIQLGATRLTDANLDAHAGQIASWRDSLSLDADLMIYGCHLAGSESGQMLLASLAALCDCDVAASDDVTGHESLGGDWDLEYTIGAIETTTVVREIGSEAWVGSLNPPADLVVTQSADGGLSINQSGNDTIFSSTTGLAANLDQLTYEVRFAADTNGGEQVFLSYNVGNEDHLSFQLQRGSNRLEIDIGAGSQIYSNALNYEAALIDGQEHTLSVTWENVLGGWQVFVDGALVDSGSGFQVGRQVLAGGTFVFGQEQDTQGGLYNSSQHFSGTIHEARLFNDVRSSLEIASNYSGAVPDGEHALLANWNFDEIDSSGVITESVGGINLASGVVTGPGFTPDDSSLVFSVEELAPDGTMIGQVIAVDTAYVSVTTDFQIVSQTVAGAFGIDSNDGTIRVADQSLLDASGTPLHEILVRATDTSGNSYDELVEMRLRLGNSEQLLITNVPLTVDEGASAVLSNAVLFTTDSEQSQSEIRYILTTAPSDGQLRLGGNELQTGMSFTQQDVADGLVSYRHGGREDASDDFQFVVDDGRGAVSIGTFDVTVNLLNDPVVITTPTSVVTDEDVAAQFGPAGVGSIQVFDEEGGTIGVTLSVADATLSFVATGGVTIADGDGSDGTLEFSGDASEVNATLSTLRLTPDAGFNGDIALSVLANDGNSISLETVDVVVTPIPSVLVWDGGGATDNWSDPLNWDLDRIPRADDTVVFDATSSSNSVVDAGYAGSIQSIEIQSTYTGQLIQASNLSVLGSLNVTGGTLDTSGRLLDVDGDWTVTGGSVDAGSSVVRVGGDFRHEAGLISAASSLRLDGTSDQSFSTTETLNEIVIDKASGVITFSGNLDLSGNFDVVGGAVDARTLDLLLSSGNAATIDGDIGPISSLEIDAASTKTIDGAIDVLGTTRLTQVALLNSGTIRGHGNVDANDNTYSGTTVLELAGNSDQSITTNGGTGMIRNLAINKSGGVAIALENLELAGAIEYIAGDLDTSGITTRFVSINLTTDTKTMEFGDVAFDGFVGATINGALLVGGDVDFSQVFFVDGGEIVVRGDVQSSDGTVLGSSALRLVGTDNQQISGADLPDGDLIVEKAGGAVSLSDDLRLNGTGQDIRVLDGELDLNGRLIQTTGAVLVTGGVISGSGDIDGGLSIGGSGSIVLDAQNSSPLGHEQLRVAGNLRVGTGATLELDVAGVSGGETIENLVIYSTRTGSDFDIRLTNNSANLIPYGSYDDVAGSLDVFFNTAPSGSIPDVTVGEDASDSLIDLSGLFNDAEQGATGLVFSLVGNDNPSLFDSITVDSPGQTIRLAYRADQNGAANLTVRVADSFGDFTDVNMLVEVTPQDDPPDFSPGTLRLNEGDTSVISSGVLSAVDIDTEDRDLEYTVRRSPLHGTVLLDGVATSRFTQEQINAGRVSFQHDGSENFIDSFALIVSDQSTSSPERVVSIVTTPVSDQAPVITSDGGGDSATITVAENSTAVSSVSVVDGDLPSETITYSLVGGADQSQFTIDGAGSLRFNSSPDAESPADSDGDGVYRVEVSVSDGVFTDTQVIDVLVVDVNESGVGPISDTDAGVNEIDVAAAPGSVVGIMAFAQDDDATDSTVSYSLVDDDGGRFSIDSANGRVTTNGSFSNADDGPSRSIVVRATSSDGSFVDRSFSIGLLHTGHAPVATNDAYSTIAGQAFRIAGQGVLANDFDVDGGSLSVTLVGGPSNGSIDLNASGQFTYTPDSGFVGSDQFFYRVDDGTFGGNVARVQIDVSVGGGLASPVATGSVRSVSGGSGSGGSGSGGSNQGAGSEGSADVASVGGLPPIAADAGGDADADFSRQGDVSDGSGSDGERDSGRDSDFEKSSSSGDVMVLSGKNPGSDAVITQNHAGLLADARNQGMDVQEAVAMQRVYESLFAGAMNDSVEAEESAQEIRQLERMLESDLKQAILWDMWDDDQSILDNAPTSMFVGTAGAAAGFFSIGYVMWALRGGAFVSVIASSLPSWRLVDPTAILTAYRATHSSSTECLTEIVGRH